ncbi:DedA family protein [Cellulomonas sp. URHB0016]
MTEVREAYRLGGVPVGIAVVVLFAIVIARSHGTYWAGRAVVRGAQQVHENDRGPGWWRATIVRLEAWTGTRAAQRGLDLVRRWGAVAVTLAYLTIGLQTAIFASAGLVRMPYLRFAIASVPGALVWAVVWATVGFGAVWGALALFAASPWALLVVVAVLLAGSAWLVRRRLLRRAADVRDDQPADALD